MYISLPSSVSPAILPANAASNVMELIDYCEREKKQYPTPELELAIKNLYAYLKEVSTDALKLGVRTAISSRMHSDRIRKALKPIEDSIQTANDPTSTPICK